MNYRSCMKLIGSKSGKNNKSGQKFRRVYQYMYRGVPVQVTRGQPVPVHVQPVPVHVQPIPVQANGMQHVPVQVQGVPVHVCPKCLECCVFVQLSPNSYTDSLGTLVND